MLAPVYIFKPLNITLPSVVYLSDDKYLLLSVFNFIDIWYISKVRTQL